MRAARHLLGVWLALGAASPLHALTIEQQAERGLEDHSARVLGRQALVSPMDSLAIELRAEWRAGFRDYNRDSRRLLEQVRLDGARRLGGPLALRWGLRQSLFNERRSLRETLSSLGELGLRWNGPLGAELLGGWLHDRRQAGADGGPRLALGLDSRGSRETWEWSGEGSWVEERPGRRDNTRLASVMRLGWRGAERQRNDLAVELGRQREDAFPDPLGEALERRKGSSLRLEDSFRSQWGEGGRTLVGVSAWHESQRRRPRAGRDSVLTTLGASLDRGVELKLEPGKRWGRLDADLSLTWRRQTQEAEYGTVASPGRTLGTVAVNRAEARLLWRPGGDSLWAGALAELRRRDSDFQGPVARDPDYMDQLRRELRLRWSHGWRPGARAGLEAGLLLGAERHLQASRSAANHMDRTWRAGADHRLAGRRLRLWGAGQALADYRLFDFEDADDPRSWIQRRLQWDERLEWAWRRAAAGWRLGWEGRGRWMEEDGGTYERRAGVQRISDSAREWSLSAGLGAKRGGWSLRPAWRREERRDWRWEEAAGRARRPLRRLVRQGPTLELGFVTGRSRLDLDLQWEWVDDQGPSVSSNRRELRARLDWRLGS